MQSMNLARLAQAVEDELQQAPDVRRWRTLIREKLNDEYQYLCELRPWPFRIREAPLFVYPDFTIAKADLDFADSQGQRVWNGTNLESTLSDVMFPLAENSGTMWAFHRENLIGAEVGIEDPSATDLANGNWKEGPFVIERVKDLGGPGPTRIWLDPRCNCTAAPDADGGDYHVRFPRYLLPADCDQLLDDGVKDEFGLALRYVHPSVHRAWSMGTERPPAVGGGFVGAWTYDEGFDTTAPLDRSHSPNLWSNASTSTTYPSWFDHHRNVSIREQIATTGSATGSTWTVGQRYRFAVSWYYANRFGPLSNISEWTPTSGLPSVVLSGMPSLPANAGLTPAVAYGWVLAIFVAVGDGPFYLLQYVDPPPSSGGTSTSVTLSTAPVATPQHRVRYDNVFAASYRYIRLLNRPSSHRKYQLRYLRRCTPLLAEEDVPELAEQFHPLIVLRAAAALAKNREQGSRTALYARLVQEADRKLAEMMQFYFPGQHERFQHGSILNVGPRANLQIRGPMDWNGDS